MDSFFSRHIAIGWGKIGDIGKQGYRSPAEIAVAIRRHYPRDRSPGGGGRSLWSFFDEMQRDDLVILSTGKARKLVVEVLGNYVFQEEGPSLNGVALSGDYQHQRRVQMNDRNPDELWRFAGAGPAPGYSPRWTLIKCARSFT